MAVDQSTVALRAELLSPSYLTRAQFKAASKAYRPVIQRISQQASALQQLLVDVEEDETNPAVVVRLESFRQTLRALQRQHDECEKRYGTLAQSFASFVDEAQLLVAAINANE